MKSSLALGLFSASALTSALRLPVQRRSAKHGANISGFTGSPATLSASSPNATNIQNENNFFYTTNITIAGVEASLQLDTGSTDLWVHPDYLPGIFFNSHNFTDVPVGVRYGKGSVQGFLTVDNVSFAGFDVTDQAFITATNATDFDSLFQHGTYGIIGFGFDTLSHVVEAVQQTYNATWGRSLLSNLFLQDTNTPNHVAFALERAYDMDDMAFGSFDVGEIDSQYAAVEQSLPIPLWPEDANRWTILLDAMSVNGQNVPLNSTFEGDNLSDPPAGKSVALLDTGASLGLLPRWAVNAIYENILGSTYNAEYDVWVVPCMGEADVSFTIGGMVVHIHPLDLTYPRVGTSSVGDKETYCVNAFEPLTIDNLPFDSVLGDSFLRNVYTVYDFGDFDASGNMGKPYIKALPLTDPVAASASFKKNRAATLAQLPAEAQIAPETTSSNLGSSANQGGSGPGTGSTLLSSGASDENTSITEILSKLSTFGPIVLALLAVNAALLIGLIAMGGFALARRNKSGTGAVSVNLGSNTRGAYAPVTKFPEDDERSRTPVGRYDTPQYS